MAGGGGYNFIGGDADELSDVRLLVSNSEPVGRERQEQQLVGVRPRPFLDPLEERLSQ